MHEENKSTKSKQIFDQPLKFMNKIFWIFNFQESILKCWVIQIMADKLNELAGKFGKGGAPKGLGVGLKLLAVAAAGAYGLKESMYTGKRSSSNDVTIWFDPPESVIFMTNHYTRKRAETIEYSSRP